MRKIDRTGESKMMNCGINATIIECTSARNVTIKFENGMILHNKKYGDFSRGLIRLPKNSKIGLKKHMKNGKSAQIVEFKKSNNILIKYDDGTLVNTSYEHFLKGTCSYPYVKEKIGECKYMHCGLKASISDGKYLNDLEITFEDGMIVKNKRYSCFAKGDIGHPLFKMNRDSYSCGKYHGKLMFEVNDLKYYSVLDNLNFCIGVMTASEILKYCKEGEQNA